MLFDLWSWKLVQGFLQPYHMGTGTIWLKLDPIGHGGILCFGHEFYTEGFFDNDLEERKWFQGHWTSFTHGTVWVLVKV